MPPGGSCDVRIARDASAVEDEMSRLRQAVLGIALSLLIGSPVTTTTAAAVAP